MTYFVLLILIAALAALVWFDVGSSRLRAAYAAGLAALAALRDQIAALLAGLMP